MSARASGDGLASGYSHDRPDSLAVEGFDGLAPGSSHDRPGSLVVEGVDGASMVSPACRLRRPDPGSLADGGGGYSRELATNVEGQGGTWYT
jgi:hypothetical protein